MTELCKTTLSLTCPHCDQPLERLADCVYEKEKLTCKCDSLNDDSMNRDRAIIEEKLDKLSALYEKIFRDLKNR
jgi:hypothetical protein